MTPFIMLFRELVTKSRSCRRFDATFPVTEDEVRNLVELACYVPSAKNLQPLKFISVCEPSAVSALFPLLSWAGYLSDWSGPEEDERPQAYVIMLGDQRISQDFACDSGITAQTILLGATASALGGCIVTSLDREKIRELFNIPECFSMLMVIALGKPAETIVIDQMEAEASVRYFRDVHGIHHVPKRVIEELFVKFH